MKTFTPKENIEPCVLQIVLVHMLSELAEMAYNMQPTAVDHATRFMELRDMLAYRD